MTLDPSRLVGQKERNGNLLNKGEFKKSTNKKTTLMFDKKKK